MARTKGELAFIDQMTRKLLVEWAHHQVVFDESSEGMKGPYLEFALEKGWVSKKDTRALTSKGWGVAAAFLRR